MGHLTRLQFASSHEDMLPKFLHQRAVLSSRARVLIASNGVLKQSKSLCLLVDASTTKSVMNGVVDSSTRMRLVGSSLGDLRDESHNLLLGHLRTLTSLPHFTLLYFSL